MNYKSFSLSCTLTYFCLLVLVWKIAEAYQIGVGRADITGPPVEINFSTGQELAVFDRSYAHRQVSTFVVTNDFQVLLSYQQTALEGCQGQRLATRRYQEWQTPEHLLQRILALLPRLSNCAARNIVQLPCLVISHQLVVP
ncbi:hypothetical protein EVAR_73349_1 [Eumeta japonica]|uniref:Uncharacterized protein n=1 Tax=Eumeta variegata TaxID=151549 RepID=A0A4C1SEZ7_EUMVA|nr:hypothetical protein EVAR_73349_1 [Eumeta japonica]